MHTTRGKSTSYYLTVDDWKRPGYSDDVKVGGGFYGAARVGDRIAVDERPGALGMAWVSRLAGPRGAVEE
jgi:hypothetical protein